MEKMPLILVVDDEELNRGLMNELLVILGYKVVLAADGEEALRKVQETAPDVILLDVMMPGINGFDVLRKLKENEETGIIPVVKYLRQSRRLEICEPLKAD